MRATGRPLLANLALSPAGAFDGLRSLALTGLGGLGGPQWSAPVDAALARLRGLTRLDLAHSSGLAASLLNSGTVAVPPSLAWLGLCGFTRLASLRRLAPAAGSLTHLDLSDAHAAFDSGSDVGRALRDLAALPSIGAAGLHLVLSDALRLDDGVPQDAFAGGQDDHHAETDEDEEEEEQQADGGGGGGDEAAEAPAAAAKVEEEEEDVDLPLADAAVIAAAAVDAMRGGSAVVAVVAGAVDAMRGALAARGEMRLPDSVTALTMRHHDFYVEDCALVFGADPPRLRALDLRHADHVELPWLNRSLAAVAATLTRLDLEGCALLRMRSPRGGEERPPPRDAPLDLRPLSALRWASLRGFDRHGGTRARARGRNGSAPVRRPVLLPRPAAALAFLDLRAASAALDVDGVLQQLAEQGVASAVQVLLQ
jgi:hypothetical protein